MSAALGWEAALDAIEEDLGLVDAAIRAGRPAAVTGWQPPRDLGPVSDALRARAEALLRRIEQVQARAHDARDALRADLADLGRRRDAGHSYASMNGGMNQD